MRDGGPGEGLYFCTMLSIEDPLRQFGEGIALTPQKSGDITLELAVQAIGIVFGWPCRNTKRLEARLKKASGPVASARVSKP